MNATELRLKVEESMVLDTIRDNPGISGAQIKEMLGWTIDKTNLRLNTLLRGKKIAYTRTPRSPRLWRVKE